MPAPMRHSDKKDAAATSELSEHLKAPPDSGSFAYTIMFWQGVGQLFPWNAFITAAAYFGTRFCQTDMANDFENYFSISFTAFQTVGLAISVMYGNKFSLHDKIVYPLAIYSSLFALTTALVLVTDINGYVLFWITFLSSSANGLAGAILSAGLFSLGGCLPPAYTAALMSGQGLAGLSVAVAGIVTQAAGPPPPGFCAATSSSSEDDGVACQTYSISYSALSYFLIATLVLGSCAVLFYVLVKLPFTEWHTRLAGVNIYSKEAPDNIKEPLLANSGITDLETSNGTNKYNASINFNEGTFSRLDDEDPDSAGASRNSNPIAAGSSDSSGNLELAREAERTQQQQIRTRSTSDVVSFKDSKLMSADTDTDDGQDKGGVLSWAEVMAILRIVKTPAFTVWLVFATTIAVFPSTIVLLQSQHHCNTDERFFNDLFVPFFFVMFNVGDFLGRIIAGHFAPILTPKNILFAGMARTVFIPLFLLCNLSNSQLPVVFKSDVFPILFMLFFALSNGYVSSTCMQMGPAMVPSSEAPLTGTIMIFCLTAGLMGGAVLSFPVTMISQGHIGAS